MNGNHCRRQRNDPHLRQTRPIYPTPLRHRAEAEFSFRSRRQLPSFLRQYDRTRQPQRACKRSMSRNDSAEENASRYMNRPRPARIGRRALKEPVSILRQPTRRQSDNELHPDTRTSRRALKQPVSPTAEIISSRCGKGRKPLRIRTTILNRAAPRSENTPSHALRQSIHTREHEL